jgi:hypothetical protein
MITYTGFRSPTGRFLNTDRPEERGGGFQGADF